MLAGDKKGSEYFTYTMQGMKEEESAVKLRAHTLCDLYNPMLLRRECRVTLQILDGSMNMS